MDFIYYITLVTSVACSYVIYGSSLYYNVIKKIDNDEHKKVFSFIVKIATTNNIIKGLILNILVVILVTLYLIIGHLLVSFVNCSKILIKTMIDCVNYNKVTPNNSIHINIDLTSVVPIPINYYATDLDDSVNTTSTEDESDMDSVV